MEAERKFPKEMEGGREIQRQRERRGVTKGRKMRIESD
jgi:hypothetical protein